MLNVNLFVSGSTIYVSGGLGAQMIINVPLTASFLSGSSGASSEVTALSGSVTASFAQTNQTLFQVSSSLNAVSASLLLVSASVGSLSSSVAASFAQTNGLITALSQSVTSSFDQTNTRLTQVSSSYVLLSSSFVLVSASVGSLSGSVVASLAALSSSVSASFSQLTSQPFITLSPSAIVSAERFLSASGRIRLTDGGAGNALAITYGRNALAPEYFIEDYGATGGLGGDDTNAWNAVIAAANASPGTIWSLSSHRVTAALNPLTNNNIHIRGRGRFNGGTIIVADMPLSASSHVFHVSGSQYCSIQDMWIAGQKVFNHGWGIRFEGTYKSSAKNVLLSNFYGGVQAYCNTFVYLEEVGVTDLYGPYGYAASGSVANGFFNHAMMMVRCEAGTNYPLTITGNPGPWVTNTAFAVGNLVLANGNIYQCAVSGTSATTGSGPTGIPTTDPNTAHTTQIFDGTARWRFAMPHNSWYYQGDNSHTYEMRNCGALQGGYGLRVETPALGSTLFTRVDNFQADHVFGAGASFAGGGAATMVNTFVTSVQDGPGIEVLSTHAGGYDFLGGDIFGCAKQGIKLYKGNGNVSNFDISAVSAESNNTYDGIEVSGAINVRIVGNSVSKNNGSTALARYGISLASDCDHFVVADNVLSGNQTGPILNNAGVSANKIVRDNTAQSDHYYSGSFSVSGTFTAALDSFFSGTIHASGTARFARTVTNLTDVFTGGSSFVSGVSRNALTVVNQADQFVLGTSHVSGVGQFGKDIFVAGTLHASGTTRHALTVTNLTDTFTAGTMHVSGVARHGATAVNLLDQFTLGTSQVSGVGVFAKDTFTGGTAHVSGTSRNALTVTNLADTFVLGTSYVSGASFNSRTVTNQADTFTAGTLHASGVANFARTVNLNSDVFITGTFQLSGTSRNALTVTHLTDAFTLGTAHFSGAIRSSTSSFFNGAVIMGTQQNEVGGSPWRPGVGDTTTRLYILASGDGEIREISGSTIAGRKVMVYVVGTGTKTVKHAAGTGATNLLCPDNLDFNVGNRDSFELTADGGNGWLVNYAANTRSPPGTLKGMPITNATTGTYKDVTGLQLGQMIRFNTYVFGTFNTGTYNNWPLASNTTTQFVTPNGNGDVIITGFAVTGSTTPFTTNDGFEFMLVKEGFTGRVVLKDNVGSATANRIFTPGGGPDYILSEYNDSVMVRFTGVQWHLIAPRQNWVRVNSVGSGSVRAGLNLIVGTHLTGTYNEDVAGQETEVTFDLAPMADARIKGRARGAGTGSPTDLAPNLVGEIIRKFNSVTETSTGSITSYTLAETTTQVRFTGSGALTIHGITTTSVNFGQEVEWHVESGAAVVVTFKHESVSATGDKLRTPDGLDFVLRANETVRSTYYDNRWRFLGGGSAEIAAGTTRGRQIDAGTGDTVNLTGAEQGENYRANTRQTVAVSGTIDLNLNDDTTVLVLQLAGDTTFRSLSTNATGDGRIIRVEHDSGNFLLTIAHNGATPTYLPFFNPEVADIYMRRGGVMNIRSRSGFWRPEYPWNNSTTQPVITTEGAGGTLTDYALPASTNILDVTATTTITGMAGGREGRRVIISNGAAAGSGVVVTLIQFTISVANNRFLLGKATNKCLYPGDSTEFIYRGSRWWEIESSKQLIRANSSGLGSARTRTNYIDTSTIVMNVADVSGSDEVTVSPSVVGGSIGITQSANMAGGTTRGRLIGTGTGAPQDLTGIELGSQILFDSFLQHSGSGGTYDDVGVAAGVRLIRCNPSGDVTVTGWSFVGGNTGTFFRLFKQGTGGRLILKHATGSSANNQHVLPNNTDYILTNANECVDVQYIGGRYQVVNMPPQPTALTPLMLAPVAAGVGVPFVIPVVLTAGVPGTPDDITVYNGNAPFAFEIVRTDGRITASLAGTIEGRTASGGGGSLLTDTFSGAALGPASMSLGLTTIATVAVSGSLFFRRSDRGIGGKMYVHAVKT
jgi:hypothetical protein